MVALPTVISCKTSRAGQGSSSELVDPAEVPEQLRSEWQALVEAREGDRSAAAVDEAADALLERAPPPELRAGALLAKAERRYLLGHDAEAITLADEALALVADRARAKSRELTSAIHETLALALVRGGDPSRALTELVELERLGALEPPILRGARAVALDRKGDAAEALAAFAAWRELLGDDSPDAGYAEERIAALVTGLDRPTIEGLARSAPGPDAAACLRATLGVEPSDSSPTWVERCRPLPARIGILLPRSGKLAALADGQFAAAVAAVTVLGRERPVAVMWKDSGSTPDTARKAALELVSDGAEVIIGPVGASNVRAAIEIAGDRRLLVPGEGAGTARGTAPSLDDRARSAVRHALAAGTKSVIVMVPQNGYGRRVTKALEKLDESSFKRLKILDYPSGTKSFDPILRPHLDALGAGSSLVIADALPRTELILRQLRRASLRVAGGTVDQEGREVLVVATGEGLAPSAIGVNHESLDGVILAPAAFPDADSDAFEQEFFAQQGSWPDDQALLVWRALRSAWSGGVSTHLPQPALVRVRGGDLVPVGTP